MRYPSAMSVHKVLKAAGLHAAVDGVGDYLIELQTRRDSAGKKSSFGIEVVVLNRAVRREIETALAFGGYQSAHRPGYHSRFGVRFKTPEDALLLARVKIAIEKAGLGDRRKVKVRWSSDPDSSEGHVEIQASDPMAIQGALEAEGIAFQVALEGVLRIYSHER